MVIKIKESHKGALHKALGISKGKKIPIGKLAQAKHSKSAKLRKQTTFALNARKWK